MKKARTKCYIYTRVSTAMQVEGCGHCRFQRSSPALPGLKTPLLSIVAQGRCAFAG